MKDARDLVPHVLLLVKREKLAHDFHSGRIPTLFLQAASGADVIRAGDLCGIDIQAVLRDKKHPADQPALKMMRRWFGVRAAWLGYLNLGTMLHTPRQRAEEKKALQDAQDLLDFVGLTGRGDLLARNLPYGEQRRLEMARALANQPKIILLDEPTAGMNPNESVTMMRFIENLRDELGITILLIEHDMKVVMGISEYIYVLDFGQLISQGNPGEIQKNPQVIESYLGRGAA